MMVAVPLDSLIVYHIANWIPPLRKLARRDNLRGVCCSLKLAMSKEACRGCLRLVPEYPSKRVADVHLPLDIMFAAWRPQWL